MGLPSRLSDEFSTWMNGQLTTLIGSLVLVYIFYKQFGHDSILSFVVYSIFMLFYLGVLWVRSVNWDGLKYAIATLVLCSVAMYFHYARHLDTASLLWPLVAMLARQPQVKAIQSAALAAVCTCVILVLSITNGFPWSELLGISGMYGVIRSSRTRQEAKRLSELHLQELNEAHQALRRAHAELEEASVQSIRYTALAERSRIARDVHDVIGHNLTTLIVQLQALRHMLPADPQTASNVIPEMLEVARTGLDEVRHAVREWAQDDTGLGTVALRGLASQVESQAALNIEFVADEDMSEWPLDVSIVLYRVMQECLTNILRYADAGTVHVHVRGLDGRVLLTISDNGSYTGEPPLQPGFGINSILERCASVGGTCTFEINPPHGLTVNVALPLQEETETV